jgi:hypothetical protein
MKIRNGFVSNSSSSCFIIAYDSKKFDPLAQQGFKRAKMFAVGVQDVFEFYKQEYQIDEDWSHDIEQYKQNFATFAAKTAKFVTAADNGKEVACLIVSDNDIDSFDLLNDTSCIEILDDFGR